MPININDQTAASAVKKISQEPMIRATRQVSKNSLIANAEIFVKYFSLIFTAIFLLAVLGLGYLLYVLVGNDFSRLETLIVQNQKEFVSKQEKIAELKNIKTDYEGLGESAKKIIEALPTKTDLPGIFIQLENLATKNNLLLNSLDIANQEAVEKKEATVRVAGLNKLSITISVSGGDYFSMKKYLADIENNLRIFDVKSLAYSPTENSYNIVLTAYYLTE